MLKRPHLVAWLIVIAGFLTFCTLIVGIVTGLRWFVFSSPVPLIAQLTVSQGSVLLQTPGGAIGVYDTQIIQPQTTVVVNDGAQGVLSFIDPYSDQPIADFTLTAGTQATLASATRPRFELSRLNYAITLKDAKGQLIVSAPTKSRAFAAEIDTYAGIATLNDYGHYTITTDTNPSTHSPQLHLFNQGGEAQIALLNGVSQKVWPNTIGNAARDQNAMWQSDSQYTLLASGLFEGQPVTPASPLPDGWQCQTGADSANPPEIAGNWSRTSGFENGALHFWRVGPDLFQRGFSQCLIYPAGEDNWLDTSGYTSLRLHVRFKLLAHDPTAPGLAVQDLPVCGNLGTECPVMVEIIASTDKSLDDEIQWHQGFYTLPDPDPSYARFPLICDTCRVPHQRTNPDVWYFYDSGDLRPQFGVNPLFIKKISVYASGHQYDVAIGEVTLLGGM